MKSTGEVMGIDESFDIAYLKSQIGAGQIRGGDKLNTLKNIFISVKDEDKEEAADIAKLFIENGFDIFSTRGTYDFLQKKGLKSKLVNKVAEGSPHVVELINQGKLDIIINTTENKQAIKDSFTIRRTAVDLNIPYYTNLRSAKILCNSILTFKNTEISVKAIQNHHIYH
jgi:carbamoyl-phosphate synthase large subunit